jgi:hypothetical protein
VLAHKRTRIDNELFGVFALARKEKPEGPNLLSVQAIEKGLLYQPVMVLSLFI